MENVYATDRGLADHRVASRMSRAILIVPLLMAGCQSASHTRPSPDAAAVTYHDAVYGFTFALTADWKNYSVLHDLWHSEQYDERLDRDLAVAQGPIIILRHPRWTSASPRQDVPILVFTRDQWQADRQEGVYPGGVVDEIAHNERYVIAAYSRFNADDSMAGSAEAGRIVLQNQLASNHLDDR